MTNDPLRALRALEALCHVWSPAAADEKRAVLRRLARVDLRTPAAVLRLHEALLRVTAYPDDAALHAQCLAMLGAFGARRDLRRVRARLADSGVVGTATRYRFFWMMLRWLARRFPSALRLDREAPEYEDRLRALLPFLLRWDVGEAVRRAPLAPFDALDRLRGTHTDAAFLAASIERFTPDTFAQEQLHEALDAAYVLDATPDTPSRTLARDPAAPVVYRMTPVVRERPDLRAALARPPERVTDVPAEEATRYVELARGCMLTRQRDLAAFSWGDARDVRVVDDGDGLRFVLIGSLPSRRLPLPVVHGWVMLRNGIPVGYVQTDALLGGVEVSFNTFPTFRGGEAAYLFSRVLAVSHHVLGARAFSIEPYQLGDGNDEGIATGAFWFYAKMGFRPRDAAAMTLFERERAAMQRRPKHRSTERTLRALARTHVYWEPFEHRALLPLAPTLGLRLDATRDDADGLAMEAAARFGVTRTDAWTDDERTAWRRMAPVLCALDGVDAWTDDERAAAVAAVRAKGAVREQGFLARLDAHARMRDALAALLGTVPRASPVPRR